MVDVGENLGGKFIFIISFLGIFVLLVSAMPSGFYECAANYEGRDFPDYWSSEDIKTLKFWGNTSIGTEDTFTIDRSPSFDNVDIWVYWIKTGERRFEIDHFWYQWGIWLIRCHVEPYPLSESNVRANIDETGNVSRFEMHCDHHNYVTYFTFDSETYSSLTEALDNEDIIVSMGMGWEYESAALSGWDLIGRLLFFQAPNIHPALNAIIALPIWAMIGYLTFRLIMIIVKGLPFT